MSNNQQIVPISPRQEEIVQPIDHRLLNPDIAKKPGISPDMVNELTEALFQNLGVSNRPEAIAIALGNIC